MKVIFLFIILFQFSHVNADEIYNLLKIPNLEIYKLKNENNIRYLNAKGDFKIGVDDNITCNKTNKENLNTCLLYTSPSPRDSMTSRMPSSA